MNNHGTQDDKPQGETSTIETPKTEKTHTSQVDQEEKTIAQSVLNIMERDRNLTLRDAIARVRSGFNSFTIDAILRKFPQDKEIRYTDIKDFNVSSDRHSFWKDLSQWVADKGIDEDAMLDARNTRAIGMTYAQRVFDMISNNPAFSGLSEVQKESLQKDFVKRIFGEGEDGLNKRISGSTLRHIFNPAYPELQQGFPDTLGEVYKRINEFLNPRLQDQLSDDQRQVLIEGLMSRPMALNDIVKRYPPDERSVLRQMPLRQLKYAQNDLHKSLYESINQLSAIHQFNHIPDESEYAANVFSDVYDAFSIPGFASIATGLCNKYNISLVNVPKNQLGQYIRTQAKSVHGEDKESLLLLATLLDHVYANKNIDIHLKNSHKQALMTLLQRHILSQSTSSTVAKALDISDPQVFRLLITSFFSLGPGSVKIPWYTGDDGKVIEKKIVFSKRDVSLGVNRSNENNHAQEMFDIDTLLDFRLTPESYNDVKDIVGDTMSVDINGESYHPSQEVQFKGYKNHEQYLQSQDNPTTTLPVSTKGYLLPLGGAEGVNNTDLVGLYPHPYGQGEPIAILSKSDFSNPAVVHDLNMTNKKNEGIKLSDRDIGILAFIAASAGGLKAAEVATAGARAAQQQIVKDVIEKAAETDETVVLPDAKNENDRLQSTIHGQDAQSDAVDEQYLFDDLYTELKKLRVGAGSAVLDIEGYQANPSSYNGGLYIATAAHGAASLYSGDTLMGLQINRLPTHNSPTISFTFKPIESDLGAYTDKQMTMSPDRFLSFLASCPSDATTLIHDVGGNSYMNDEVLNAMGGNWKKQVHWNNGAFVTRASDDYENNIAGQEVKYLVSGGMDVDDFENPSENFDKKSAFDIVSMSPNEVVLQPLYAQGVKATHLPTLTLSYPAFVLFVKEKGLHGLTQQSYDAMSSEIPSHTPTGPMWQTFSLGQIILGLQNIKNRVQDDLEKRKTEGAEVFRGMLLNNMPMEWLLGPWGDSLRQMKYRVASDRDARLYRKIQVFRDQLESIDDGEIDKTTIMARIKKELEAGRRPFQDQASWQQKVLGYLFFAMKFHPYSYGLQEYAQDGDFWVQMMYGKNSAIHREYLKKRAVKIRELQVQSGVRDEYEDEADEIIAFEYNFLAEKMEKQENVFGKKAVDEFGDKVKELPNEGIESIAKYADETGRTADYAYQVALGMLSQNRPMQSLGAFLHATQKTEYDYHFHDEYKRMFLAMMSGATNQLPKGAGKDALKKLGRTHLMPVNNFIFDRNPAASAIDLLDTMCKMRNIRNAQGQTIRDVLEEKGLYGLMFHPGKEKYKQLVEVFDEFWHRGANIFIDSMSMGDVGQDVNLIRLAASNLYTGPNSVEYPSELDRDTLRSQGYTERDIIIAKHYVSKFQGKDGIESGTDLKKFDARQPHYDKSVLALLPSTAGDLINTIKPNKGGDKKIERAFGKFADQIKLFTNNVDRLSQSEIRLILEKMVFCFMQGYKDESKNFLVGAFALAQDAASNTGVYADGHNSMYKDTDVRYAFERALYLEIHKEIQFSNSYVTLMRQFAAFCFALYQRDKATNVNEKKYATPAFLEYAAGAKRSFNNGIKTSLFEKDGDMAKRNLLISHRSLVGGGATLPLLERLVNELYHGEQTDNGDIDTNDGGAIPVGSAFAQRDDTKKDATSGSGTGDGGQKQGDPQSITQAVKKMSSAERAELGALLNNDLS